MFPFRPFFPLAMNYLLLPDFLAMSFLVLVLALVRRRYQKDSMRLWTTGLLLILLECAARMAYGMHLPPTWHKVMHVIALDAYFLAGAFFLRSAASDFKRMGYSGIYLMINVLPHLVLLSIYGSEIRAGIIYRVIAIAGCLIGFISATVLRRHWPHYLAFVCIWTPMIIAASNDSFRTAIYISLFSLYLLTAIAFATSLPSDSRGKITLVTGFTVWSLCFLTHPWIAASHPEWAAFASEIWNMQKFLISIGFLLVLFEKQLESNVWLALHDQLTGLANRRLFDDRMANALQRAERDRSSLLLFNLDLDGFKEVNDTLGHDVGDVLLKRVSENLLNAVRRTDTLARLGGDEFSLLAVDMRSGDPSARSAFGPASGETEAYDRNAGEQTVDRMLATASPEQQPLLLQARRICRVLKQAASKPVVVQTQDGPRTISVSVSIGIAVYPADAHDALQLARIADRRMYEDKRAGSTGRLPLLDRMLALLPGGKPATAAES